MQQYIDFMFFLNIFFQIQVAALSTLPQLTKLFYDVLEVNPQYNQNTVYAQLRSVRELQINFQLSRHTDLEVCNLGWIFPNVRVFHLHCYNYGCFDCGYDYR